MTRVLLCALEPSADRLAAGLLREAARAGDPWDSRGLAGREAARVGFGGTVEPDRYAVMGLTQALVRLPSFLALRRRLLASALAEPPDVFVGIDAPDFHLPLARTLRARGTPAVQYVSPTVWAWREERVAAVAESVDLVLCLFPFEPAFYEGTGVEARFVGHPLAESLAPAEDRAALRERLGWRDATPRIVLAPGSRRQELRRHAPLFFAAAAEVHRRSGARFALACAPASDRAWLAAEAERQGLSPKVLSLHDGATEILAAADAALVKSGTTTLEATLVGCPMVVAYRIGRLNASFILARGFRTPWIALPNILAGRPVVPEFIQDLARPGILAGALVALLRPENTARVRDDLVRLGAGLRRGADARAREAVADLAARRRHGG